MSQYDVVIVGGGISGLSALHFLRRLKPHYTVRLFEAGSRLGGTIGTDHADGYSLDQGPNGFLDREPLTLQLCDELGLTDHLERADQNVSNRFILRKGRLHTVPMSPPSFLLSDILSLKGRLRVLMEPFASRADGVGDESIYDFARRRIGREAADYLIQPMVSGIYGGLADRLSLKSCFPVMKEMEDEFGSLFKAMIAKARKARAEGRKSGGPAGPGGWLTSFEGGLYVIIDRFADFYGQFISTGLAVESVEKNSDDFHLRMTGGQTARAKRLILALPSYSAARIVGNLSERLSKSLASIPYAPIAVVCLGYPVEAVHAELDGFGFLVPQKEKRRILGSIWTSSIFKGRVPQGHAQFRTMVGGDGDHESADLSDDELISRVRKELESILEIEGEPDIARIYRWAKGIPQYRPGHSNIIDCLESELKTLGNIHITGNAYYGIGLNDCVRQSHRIITAL